MTCLLALDPGSDKCGYAVLTYQRELLVKGIAYLGELGRLLPDLVKRYQPVLIILGSGTAAKVVKELVLDLQLNLEIKYGNERNSTLEGRDRYFLDHPPTGLWRLVPLSLQIPPCDVDDYAALIIGERYLQEHGLEEK
jgi:RNase H-fold protein (predicted Holliday junction resolvase)